MKNKAAVKELPPTTLWVIALVCVATIIFAICGGAAFASIRQARLTAAQASCGQIEAVLFLAEIKAEQNGLGTRPSTFSDLLKSYDTAAETALSPYERFVLQAMMESFGSHRSFDFAVTRFEDGAGVHTQIYLFPVRGRTDVRRDRYYLMADGLVTEYNG